MQARSATAARALWDDVDDYDGWSASPPEEKDGTAITWASDFTRAVSVDWVVRSDLSQTTSSETQVKRIEVTVSRGEREIVTLVAYRTSSWVTPADRQGGGG